jgi:methionine synthase II (cobalamin-independent)
MGCIDTVNLGVKDNYRRIMQQRSVPRVIGKVARRAPAALEDLRFARAHTTRPVKMAVPAL